MNVWFDYIQNMIYQANYPQSDIIDHVLHRETAATVSLTELLMSICQSISPEDQPSPLCAYNIIIEAVS